MANSVCTSDSVCAALGSQALPYPSFTAVWYETTVNSNQVPMVAQVLSEESLSAVPADCDGALVLLGDMPGISPALLDKLIAAFDPGEDRAICVATRHGKRGNPVLWARRFFPEILAIEGDVGARHLIGQYADMVVEVEAADDGPLTDIDTPEALAAYRARAATDPAPKSGAMGRTP